MPKLTDQELLDLILGLEDELLAEGMDPKKRAVDLPIRAMEKLGYQSFTLSGPHAPEVLQRIYSIQKSLYRKKDIGVGGVHGGAFMFRGIAVAIRIPLFFGTVKLKPFDHNDLSRRQIEWLQSDAKHIESYVVTFCDLFDLAGCVMSYSGYMQPTGLAASLFGLVMFQIQAAGATLCAAFDERGAVQSSLIAAELSLKAALAAKGKNEAELKSFGHDRSKLVDEVDQLYQKFDTALVRSRMQVLPDLVPNRYSSAQPSRMETGEIVMAAQFLAGEAARAVTGGSLRRNLKFD